jgi:hypothetical protein
MYHFEKSLTADLYCYIEYTEGSTKAKTVKAKCKSNIRIKSIFVGEAFPLQHGLIPRYYAAEFVRSSLKDDARSQAANEFMHCRLRRHVYIWRTEIGLGSAIRYEFPCIVNHGRSVWIIGLL